MAQHGSPLFQAYSRNLRRLFWSEFIDQQMELVRPATFHASLVDNPLSDADSLINAYDYHRHRTTVPPQD